MLEMNTLALLWGALCKQNEERNKERINEGAT